MSDPTVSGLVIECDGISGVTRVLADGHKLPMVTHVMFVHDAGGIPNATVRMLIPQGSPSLRLRCDGVLTAQVGDKSYVLVDESEYEIRKRGEGDE